MSFSKDLPDNLTGDGFSNWCCCVLGLRAARNVLEKFSNIKSEELQSKLKEKYGDRICAGSHDLQVKGGNVTVKCPGKECVAEKWATTLFQLNQNRHMNNVNINRWTTDPTSIQVLFMAYGYGGHKDGEGIDPAGLLKFLTNCKAFHADATDCEIRVGDFTNEVLAKLKKLQEMRNNLMHSASSELSLEEKNDYFVDLMSFLQIPDFIGMKDTYEKAKSEMITLRDCLGGTKAKILITHLENTFKILRGCKEQMQNRCADFNKEQTTTILIKAKNYKADGWKMMKKEPLVDDNERRDLCDILEQISSCITTVDNMLLLYRCQIAQEIAGRISCIPQLQITE